MKILFVGNSQLACLLECFNAELILPEHDCAFYAVPGGFGPYVYIQDGVVTLLPGRATNAYPPITFPDADFSLRVTDYDAIVISALGLFDDPQNHKHSLCAQGQVADFGPKHSDTPAVSKNLLAKIAENFFASQGGMLFASQLRSNFQGSIYIQRFPRLSADVLQDENWALNILYERPVEAFRFFSSLCNTILEKFCSHHSLTLLDEPNLPYVDGVFTPSEYVGDDMVHPRREYAALVWSLIEDALTAN